MLGVENSIVAVTFADASCAKKTFAHMHPLVIYFREFLPVPRELLCLQQ